MCGSLITRPSPANGTGPSTAPGPGRGVVEAPDRDQRAVPELERPGRRSPPTSPCRCRRSAAAPLARSIQSSGCGRYLTNSRDCPLRRSRTRSRRSGSTRARRSRRRAQDRRQHRPVAAGRTRPRAEDERERERAEQRLLHVRVAPVVVDVGPAEHREPGRVGVGPDRELVRRRYEQVADERARDGERPTVARAGCRADTANATATSGIR